MARNGLRLLSFDAGGIRALSQLKVMENIIHRIQYDRLPNEPDNEVLPCECFDAMAGSDTGGLISLMFSKLRMSVQDTMEEFHKICLEVYADGLSAEERSGRLRKSVEDLLRRRGFPIDLKLGKDSRVTQEGCPCLVLATLRASMDTRVRLRTYPTRTELASEITIVDAILATCATQPSFLPIITGREPTQQELIGGAISAGNPTRELMLEAYNIFGKDAHISTIVSMGSGHLGPLPAPTTNAKEKWMSVLQGIVQSCERTAQDIATEVGHLGLYYRFSVEQGLQRTFGVKSTDVSWLNTQTQSYVDGIQVSHKIDHCVESLRLRQGQITLEKLKYSSGTTPVYKSIPPLSSYFVLRKEPWAKITAGLIDHEPSESIQRILVVSGMGGCGKTQLAIRFIHEYKLKFKYTFFVDGSTRESIQADIINQVRTASMAYAQASFSEALCFFYNPQHQPCLLIYDNVDDVKLDITSLIPECTDGTIIITTRNRSLGQFASPPQLHLELDVMSMEEATNVFLRSAKLEHSDSVIQPANAIANELGNLPVALVQAGSYIYQSSCSLDAYLLRLRDHKLEMMYTPASDRLRQSTYAAFDISYRNLPENAQNFLHIIGCSHFSSFPMEAIAIGSKSLFQLESFQFIEPVEKFEDSISLLTSTFCPAGFWDECTIDDLVKVFRNYSLATFTQSPTYLMLHIHPLIHNWAFGLLDPKKRAIYRAAASRIIACASAANHLHTTLLPHIDAILLHKSKEEIPMADCASFGLILRNILRHEDSRKVWQNIYDKLICIKGNQDLHIATVLLELAYTFEDDLEMMERLEKQAVNIRRDILGTDHLDTLEAESNLGGTYHRRGRLLEAENIKVKVLEKFKLHLGDSSPRTLSAKHELASVYHSQGRYSESEILQTQVLGTRIKMMGNYHRESLNSKVWLAATYRAQGRYFEAASFQKEVMEIQITKLGKLHPDTGDAISQLASTYYLQDQYHESKSLQEEVLTLRRTFLGETHPTTIDAMAQLALTNHSQGNYSEALSLRKQVVQLRSQRLGCKHQDSLTAMSDLASTYYSQRQYVESEKLLEQVLKLRREHLGDNHPATALAMNNLAWTYYQLGRLIEARNLALMAHQTSELAQIGNDQWSEQSERLYLYIDALLSIRRWVWQLVTILLQTIVSPLLTL